MRNRINISRNLGLILGIVTLLYTGHVVAAAKNAAYINNNLRLGYTTAIAMDSNHTYGGNSTYTRESCAETILSNYSSWKGAKLYNDGKGNGLSPTGKSASYRYDTWISRGGTGNASIPMTFTYTNIINANGTVNPIGLQINSLSFVCRPFAKPVPTNSCGLTGSQWVNKAGTPKDGWITAPGDADSGVHDTGTRNYSSTSSESCFINLKEWQHIQIQNLSVKSITSSDGAVLNKGTVDQPADNSLTLTKDASSRYWLASPSPFNYNPNSASVQYAATHNTLLTVKVTMTFKQQNKYENDVIFCDDGTKDGLFETHASGEIKWSKCQNDTTDLTFAITFDPPPLANDVSCRQGLFKSDMTVGRPQTLNGAGAKFSNAWPTGVSISNVNVTGPANPSSITLPTPPGYDRDGVSNALTVRDTTFTPTVAGDYTVHYTVGGNGITSMQCETTGTVGAKPYFTVNGGDIIAGITFAHEEPDGASLNAAIASWDGYPLNYDGAKGNLAAIASGDITQFSSGMDAANPSRLAFANDSSAAPRYGGGFKALPSTPDYIDDALKSVNSSPQPCPAIPINIGNIAPGVYKCTSDVTFQLSSISGGKNVTIIVDGGSVFISGNLGYTYAGLSDIPRLNVYTTGNIVVGKDVTDMHGVFIAQGRDKKFYSCGGSATTGYPYDGLNSHVTDCNQNLTVHGTVMAGELVLGRTLGSWTTPAVGPAETFDHSPETWLSQPLNTGTGTNPFDSYISLPPVL